MDQGKVEAVRNWPQPTTVKELQKFLGFANFYRRFIAQYSQMSAPLTSLLRHKPKSLSWTPEATQAFQHLKFAFCSAQALFHPNPNLRFVVEVDASTLGVRAVLSQWKGEPPVLHPRFKVQGFFICHIIVIQGITRSEMQSNQVRSVTVQNNKNTIYISNITQGHTYGKKRRNKNKMCNEVKKCKTIRCAKNNKMCKRQ